MEERSELDKILNSFTSNDVERLMSPFSCGEWNGIEYVCGTDGKWLILVPAEEVPIYGRLEKQPDAISIMPDFEVDEPIDIQELEEALVKIPIVEYPDSIECDICDGDKKFRHGSHLYDCLECDGTGMITIKGSTVKDYQRDICVLWNGTMMVSSYFAKVVNVLKRLGGRQRILYRRPVKMMIEANGCYILLMGALQDDEYLEKAIKVGK